MSALALLYPECTYSTHQHLMDTYAFRGPAMYRCKAEASGSSAGGATRGALFWA